MYSQDREELASPLLLGARSEVDDEFGEEQLSNTGIRMETTPSSSVTSPTASSESAMLSSGPMSNAGVRRVVYWFVQKRTLSDALPTPLQMITNNGKMSLVVFLGGYIFFIALWLPFWLLSFVTSEWGIYVLFFVSVFMIGRSIIRLIAFPGSSNRVSSEMEKEFNKYSVRMILSAANSLLDLASTISSANGGGGGGDDKSSSSIVSYEIPTLWKRAKSYRDRVLGVYTEVLQYLLNKDDVPPPTSSSSSSSASASDLTPSGNNKLSGDIGDLSGLTVSVMLLPKKRMLCRSVFFSPRPRQDV